MAEPLRETPPHQSEALPARHGLAVLVADDAPYLRAVLVRLLTAAGHCCVAAEDGEGALAAARTGRFDLLITDYEMPALDGCALIAQVRAGEGPNRHTPALLLTGHADEAAVRERASAAGVDAVLAKPVAAAELLRAVAALARRPAKTA